VALPHLFCILTLFGFKRLIKTLVHPPNKEK
jgi:hypothetical protein